MTKNCEENILQGHSNRTQEHAVSTKQTWAVRGHHWSTRVFHSSVVAKEKTKTKQNPVHAVSSRTARATGWEPALETRHKKNPIKTQPKPYKTVREIDISCLLLPNNGASSCLACFCYCEPLWTQSLRPSCNAHPSSCSVEATF